MISEIDKEFSSGVGSQRWADPGLPFDLRALRYAIAAAEHLSFSKAALALDTCTSSVSRSIRDFEDSVGVSLFQRTTMGVHLTDAGATSCLMCYQRSTRLRPQFGVLARQDESKKVWYGSVS